MIQAFILGLVAAAALAAVGTALQFPRSFWYWALAAFLWLLAASCWFFAFPPR